MPPKINRKETGINLRRIMDRRGLSVKDIQQYLGLDSVQSIYHWLNGLSMPTLDNLYSLSTLFQVTLDELVCGNREPVGGERAWSMADPQLLPGQLAASRARRIFAYYRAISGGHAA